MNEVKEQNGDLPPDIIQETLPFLTMDDIKSLSLTNRYYNKLLDYTSSETLWHELFNKTYDTSATNHEPFYTKNTEFFNSCPEQILSERYPHLSWHDRYKLRSDRTKFYTWGSVKHARLGYTAASNRHIVTNSDTDDSDDFNDNGIHLENNWNASRMGVCKPTMVPWYPIDNLSDDPKIVQISGGGFSFQILTKSGKIFSSGATFTGGYKGPGPKEGEHDYNQFREYIRHLEANFANNSSPITGNSQERHPLNTHRTTFAHFGGLIPLHAPRRTITTNGPHLNMYEEIEKLEEQITEIVPGNPHQTRMYPKESLPIFDVEENIPIKVDKEKLDSIKFVAITSGRSHFLALSSKNEVYSWDNPESNGGIKINFPGIEDREKNPILKIASGWNFNCVYLFNVGLITWKERDALNAKEISANAHYEIIPGTGEIKGDKKVIDFSCLSDNVIYYIDKVGKVLYKYSNMIVEGIKLPINGKLSKLISGYNFLVLFCGRDSYSFKLEGNNINIDTMKKIILDDEDDSIISLAGGDYHELALTKKGHLYSWGTESQVCGCLGLGQYEPGGWGTIDGNNINVKGPTRVDIGVDSTCMAVTGGGWQSGALIMSE